jgi:precorrin isomerase/sirohydrochlorin ferrochelatase
VTVHPIEAESYRVLASRVDLSGMAAGPAAVAARIVHATAEPGLVADLVVDEAGTAAGVTALVSGAPVLCDVEMVRAGISGVRAQCALRDTPDAGSFPSRSAAAMAALASRNPDGAVVVVGCAPTALAEVNRMIGEGTLRPALVIGVAVGFVGAAQSKEELLAVAGRSGVPVIVLRGERGGAAVAAAAVNSLVRLAAQAQRPAAGPQPGPAWGCLLIGHGTRSPRGVEELRRFAGAVAAARGDVVTRAGFIEHVDPPLDEAIDDLVAAGPTSVVAVPLVLLGAGHMKDDGPAALARARVRHPGVTFSYARDLGVHPHVLGVVTDRIADASARLPGAAADAVVVVGRGSSDPDANADLAKAARLLADGRGLGGGLVSGELAAGGLAAGGLAAGGLATGAGVQSESHEQPREGPPPLGLVVPAFVSLAKPGVPAALDQCARLGATRIAVVPYFLFDGLLVERIGQQVAAWASAHPRCTTATGHHMGVDPRLVDLAWFRYDEAAGGPVHMNCDGCLYRTPLPGYEHRVAR